MRTKALTGVLLMSGVMMLAGAAIGAQDATPQAPVRKLELKFNNGLVTLKAQNVTVREILAEWAKRCDCQIVGADKITNSAITVPVQYENKPEADIIKSLLNPGTVSGGYFFLPRNPGERGASMYASLNIMAVSHPSAITYSASSSPVAAPLVTNVDDEIPPVANIPLQQSQQQQAPQNKPAGPSLPPGVVPAGVVPITAVPPSGPGTPTVPPVSGGRGGH